MESFFELNELLYKDKNVDAQIVVGASHDDFEYHGALDLASDLIECKYFIK